MNLLERRHGKGWNRVRRSARGLRAAVLAATLAALPSLLSAADAAPRPARWAIGEDHAITWTPKPGEAHEDTIEMTGQRVSVIATYGVDAAGHFTLSRQVIWPLLRFKPNMTRDHFAVVFGEEDTPRVYLDNLPVKGEKIHRVALDGLLHAEGTLGAKAEIAFERVLFPAVQLPAVLDRTVFTNRSNRDVAVDVEENGRTVKTAAVRGIDGGYEATAMVFGAGVRTLHPGESMEFTLVLAARRTTQPPFVQARQLTQTDAVAVMNGPPAVPTRPINVLDEQSARESRVAAIRNEMVLTTPDQVLNTAFAFAKIRAAESIFATKAGLLHSPGGGAYYAAIWANDQGEYSGPFFGMLGDATAREAALNAYRLFAKYINPNYEPIPSSIISEGAATWHGAGDRGDMAMIAYGAARYALERGDQATAEKLWPLIEWCLEYCRRKVTADGVVASDADELENRFPAGKANLCTSSLYYDALNSAAYLAGALGKPQPVAEDYRTRATAVRAAIERYFGATVEGFATYRYFDKSVPAVNTRALERHRHYASEPDHLRAWICIPLTVGIYDRAPATINALFSPQLWTPDGLATEAGKETFWDRSTLYALRGVFAAGETQRALDYLTYYSNRRLLGEHVPYPVEAYPEGNQRHLSAESALYCRIYTEGLFGIRPTGLRSFDLTPRLPKAWPAMAMKNVHAFGAAFDLSVQRDGDKLKVEVTKAGQTLFTQTIADGATTHVTL